MIAVGRTAPEPKSLRSAAAKRARAAAAESFGRRRSSRAGTTYDFRRDIYAAKDVDAALRAMFGGKCAFCESAGTVRPPGVIHYRPEHMAFDLDRVHPDHYWWCAYEWSNLYLACNDCALAKGSRFPVANRRARLRAEGVKLAAEGPLLLDPCADDPEEHLIYADDGLVASETERGNVTIAVLDLNRRRLVRARAATVAAACTEWEANAPDRLDAFFDPAREYAGVRRQLARRWASEAGIATRRPAVSAERQDRARQRRGRYARAHTGYTLGGRGRANAAYFATAHHVERIEIRNFRLIRELNIDVPRASRLGAAPWLMLLGDNGTGKSSVLEGIALALVGDEYRTRLALDASEYVRNDAKSGSVTVRVSGFDDPIELRVRAGSAAFESSLVEPKVLVLGYGPTRLLPRAGVEPGEASEFAHVDSLFNPFVPLYDPRPWLSELPEERFKIVRSALERLLLLPRGARIERGDEGLQIRGMGTTLTLDDLGDGHQSVIALATDALRVLVGQDRWHSPELAEGIMVIDQVETHIHPRWRMRIVGSLRRVFPRLQFLVCTHDPLCLRGLRDGETMLLRRTRGGANAAVTVLPSFRGLRIDQMLGSEMFGLDSTVDPEIDRLMERYRELRWKSRRTKEENQELREVRSRLNATGHLGRDRREQIVLAAADEYIRKEGQVTTGAERSQLHERTKVAIASLFADAVRERKEDG